MQPSPSSERVHIAFFGARNAGKSSVINALTEQTLSIVSDVLGTTTDPVYKSMELFPLGPCVIIDTAGIDDEGDLGKMRVERTFAVLAKTDIAVLVIDAAKGMTADDEGLLAQIKERKLPYILCFNKTDIAAYTPKADNELAVSAATGKGIEQLRIALGRMADDVPQKYILRDLVSPGDTVVLVIPIDKSAPKGRLILPQQQVLRELIEYNCITLCVSDEELEAAIEKYGKSIGLVITDSQAFARVKAVVPEDIPLTSFSILFMRYKGELDTAIQGAKAIDALCDGDKVLISEGCTHHKQCDDIGTVKIPRMLEKYTGKKLIIEHTSGTEFKSDLKGYKLVIHCGGCMLNEREVKSRMKRAGEQGVPFTNYGVALSLMTGVLERATRVFN